MQIFSNKNPRLLLQSESMGWAMLGLLLGAGFFACPRAQTDSLNNLNAKELAEGWKLLWDGKTQKGLHNYLKGSMTDPWKLEDSAISNPGNFKDMCADADFGDFELTFDWKINKAGNSGVWYRVSETLPEPWHSGPEYAILDNKDGEDAAHGPLFYSGANYGMQPTTKTGHPDSAVIDITKPIGQYNRSRIRVLGDSVEHWLNDQRVVAYRFHSALWDKQRTSSKFKISDHPQYGGTKIGKLCFQDHGGGLRVWFRNIKVRTLTGTTFPTGIAASSGKMGRGQAAKLSWQWVSPNQTLDLQGRRKDWEVVKLRDPRP